MELRGPLYLSVLLGAAGLGVASASDRDPALSQDTQELQAAVLGIDFIRQVLQPQHDRACRNRDNLALSGKPARPACEEKGGPVLADDSPQRAYFEKLLQRGMSAPIEEFLVLWYPDRVRPTTQAYFFSCQDRPWGPLRYRGGALERRCAPDVLYSWGPRPKLESMKAGMGDGRAWSGSPNPGRGKVWATLSPVSTYSYGMIPVRVKLKPGTRFPERSGTPRSVTTWVTTLMDFLITDASVIESWSYGTPEHYDEIVKDVRRIASGERAQTYVLGESRQRGLKRVYDAGVPEAGPQDEATLKRNLLEMIRMILNGEGRIHYAAGACRSRVEHFKTTRPTYFNEE